MFRVLIRLYLITIVTFAAAIYLVPRAVIQLFEHRYMSYNIEQSRGMQSLIVKEYQRVPMEQWANVTVRLAADFAPLKVQLLRIQDASYTPEEQRLLKKTRW